MKLRDYQISTVGWLCDTPRANLFATPGMGKTATILAFLQARPDCTLIVAPKLVAQTVWPEQARLWSQFKITPAVLWDKSWIPDAQVTVIHPELIPWLAQAWGNRWPYSTVVWDESTRLRGFRPRGKGTARAGALEPYAHTRIKRWVNLSGTPSANTYLHLWGPNWFIDEGRSLGRSHTAFKERWFYRPAGGGGNWYDPVLPHVHAVGQMALAMQPYTRVLRAEDYFDLEKPVERVIRFPLPDAAQRAYDRMRRHLQVELASGTIQAMNAGVKALKLRQISSGAVYGENMEDYHVIHTARLEVLRSIVEELAGTPLLVVYTFKHEMHQIQQAFPGAMELRERGAVDRWNKGQLPMLLAHPASAGHGLNLQEGGHHMVFFTPLSDNELYSQVCERIGATRQAQSGHARAVYFHHIESNAPIDAASRKVRETRIGWLQALLEALK
jgi:SNF2 family DNA or RNA helicase